MTETVVLPFDLVAFHSGTLEMINRDIDWLLQVESEGGYGAVIGLTSQWHKLESTLVGLVLHVFDGTLAVAYVDGELRLLTCQDGAYRVLRVGSSEGELL